MEVPERRALEQRKDELARAIAPYAEDQRRDVAAALAEMFQSYRSMRQTDQEAMSVIQGAARALAPYPLWAICRACDEIRATGVFRSGAYDRQWPPNDSEILDVVSRKVALYRAPFDSAVALLNAKVER